MSDIIRNFLISADNNCPASWTTQIRDELKNIESIKISIEKVTIIYYDGITVDYYPENPAKIAFAFKLAGARNCEIYPKYGKYADDMIAKLADLSDLISENMLFVLDGCWFRHQLELVLDAHRTL